MPQSTPPFITALYTTLLIYVATSGFLLSTSFFFSKTYEDSMHVAQELILDAVAAQVDTKRLQTALTDRRATMNWLDAIVKKAAGHYDSVIQHITIEYTGRDGKQITLTNYGDPVKDFDKSKFLLSSPEFDVVLLISFHKNYASETPMLSVFLAISLILSIIAGAFILRIKRMLLAVTDGANLSLDLDMLTGCYNKSYGDQVLLNLIETRIPTSVILINNVNFAKVNETYGYEAGNIVLKNIAKVLLRCCRLEDVIVRLTGSTFLVIMPDTSSVGAEKCAKRIKRGLDGNVSRAASSVFNRIAVTTVQPNDSVAAVVSRLVDATKSNNSSKKAVLV